MLSRSGREVSTVLAFTRWLLQFLQKQEPISLACFFDESLGNCFRHELDPGYKANRSLPDDALAYELLACRKICQLLGVQTYASEYYEADDLIATCASTVYAQKDEPYIVTRDKDLGQLLELDCGYFWDYGYDDPIAYASFANEFGIEPKHMADFLAIAGDSSDCIVGVKGVGKKTVAALFKFFDGWSELRENIAQVAGLPIRGAAGLASKLALATDLVEHNLKLTRLCSTALRKKEISFHRSPINVSELEALLNEFNAPLSLIEKAKELQFQSTK